MSKINIPLTDPSLEAEITTTLEGNLNKPAVLFLCPLCRGHYHLIFFNPGSKEHGTELGQHVWGNPKGTTLKDLTLSPSYRATCPREEGKCHLHLWVRKGVMQILPDSSPLNLLIGEED